MEMQIKLPSIKTNEEIRCSKRDHKVAEIVDEHIFIKCPSCREKEIVAINMKSYTHK